MLQKTKVNLYELINPLCQFQNQSSQYNKYIYFQAFSADLWVHKCKISVHSLFQ